jgi:hypothetical protein
MPVINHDKETQHPGYNRLMLGAFQNQAEGNVQAAAARIKKKRKKNLTMFSDLPQ